MRIALVFSGLGVLALSALVYFNTTALNQVTDLAAVLTRAMSTSVAAPAERAAPPPVPVQVAAVQRAAVPIYLNGIGTVQAYNMVAVKSRVDGEITKILFQEGQDVTAGEPIAIIDPRPFQAQLDQQVAALAKDQALLDGAIADMRRYDELVQRNFASRQQVDQQHALVDQYRAQLKTDQAQIDFARNQLAYTTIRSPLTGRIGIRQIDQGNFIRATDGGAIAMITQLQPISVVFTIAAVALEGTKLTPGRAEAAVTAIGQDNRTELDHGRVELVDNQVDPATGTIKVKASFPNAALRLWPGNFVNGRITVETRRNGLTVPAVAVRHGPRGDFVWLVKEDNTVTARNVATGQVADGRVLIERGLAAEDRVVVEGYYRLENGTRVEIQAAKPAPRPG
ncbi:MAG TPA: efflux RND transporter periplasmic adaptor subunit [Acidisoma sp.]|uniref:efflux RND transporter periplasmic adaptor subunit n=1 Tax=Acidisoma sp. TaxID=1872115 RepID=UPI002BC58E6E|nr:efflux RND transporter periplasmic adaptor subunit [Acidisoma sp.]HTI01882.1 efflux RND transporter periplasmic adaptor subunit [Acidisoma sp.]